MESASEVGVTLKQGYNGDLTACEAGSIGGQMIKDLTRSQICFRNGEAAIPDSVNNDASPKLYHA